MVTTAEKACDAQEPGRHLADGLHLNVAAFRMAGRVVRTSLPLHDRLRKSITGGRREPNHHESTTENKQKVKYSIGAVNFHWDIIQDAPWPADCVPQAVLQAL